MLVHDDVDVWLGDVRVKTKGGDGGHRGVRSIIHALQTERIGRVKIGVGRPKGVAGAAGHVLGEFTADERAAIERAYETAARDVHRVITTTPDGRTRPAARVPAIPSRPSAASSSSRRRPGTR